MSDTQGRSEPFDWDRVVPGTLDALSQAIADRVHDVSWCSNEDAMWVISDLWDAGYRLVPHAPLAALPEEPWMERLRKALGASAREVHRWHTQHRTVRPVFEICADPHCAVARAALASPVGPLADAIRRER